MKSVLKFCEAVRKTGEKDDQPNKNGNTVYRASYRGNRYAVDFADDFNSEGWRQFDTSQDAPYFGFWVNPKHKLTLTYCEGDVVLVDCPTVESYLSEIRSAISFYDEGQIATAIGMDGSATVFRQDRAEFLKITGT